MKHKIDLYKCYKKTNRKSTKLSLNTIVIVFPIIVLITVLVSFYNQQLQLKHLNNELQINQRYLDDESVKLEFEEVIEMQATLGSKEEYTKQLDDLIDVLGNKKKIYSYVFNAVEAAMPPGVVVDLVVLEKFDVVINFKSSSPTGPALLARNLRRNSSFTNVTYNGMKQEGASEATSYTGSINLNLTGGF